MHDNDNAPRLVSMNAVAEMTSLSRTAINKHRATGNFPIEVSLGQRRIAFVKSEIQAWIDARIAARATA